jgi:hypothetical protein
MCLRATSDTPLDVAHRSGAEAGALSQLFLRQAVLDAVTPKKDAEC